MGEADQIIKKLLSNENIKQQTILQLKTLAEQANKVKELKQKQEFEDKKKREQENITNIDPALTIDDHNEDTKNDI